MRPKQQFQRRSSNRASRREREKIYMYGKHALTEALLYAPQVIKKVFLSLEAARDKDLQELLKREKIDTAMMKNQEAARMVGEHASHQGVIAVSDTSLLLRDFAAFVEGLKLTPHTMLVLLDELTDPQNVGAIIRTAAAFGAAGVLLPSHNQVAITGAVVKASVGMVFRLPIVSLGNVNQSVDILKKKGFWSYALTMEGKNSIEKEVFDAPALFIVGNEGRGIRQKTLERTDIALRIPMDPRCESLNASVATAVALYQWSTQHRGAFTQQ